MPRGSAGRGKLGKVSGSWCFQILSPLGIFLGEKVGFATDTSVREGWLINLILFLIDFHISLPGSGYRFAAVRLRTNHVHDWSRNLATLRLSVISARVSSRVKSRRPSSFMIYWFRQPTRSPCSTFQEFWLAVAAQEVKGRNQ